MISFLNKVFPLLSVWRRNIRRFLMYWMSYYTAVYLCARNTRLPSRSLNALMISEYSSSRLTGIVYFWNIEILLIKYYDCLSFPHLKEFILIIFNNTILQNQPFLLCSSSKSYLYRLCILSIYFWSWSF